VPAATDLTDVVPALGAPSATAAVRQLPLFPYPELPAYRGHGNVDGALVLALPCFKELRVLSSAGVQLATSAFSQRLSRAVPELAPDPAKPTLGYCRGW
jgi:hypothetical protein